MSEIIVVAMKYGLSENTLQQIRHIFMQFPEIEQVLLYGSRALGTHHPGSDIDLVFIGLLINDNTISLVNEKLDMLSTPYLFDIGIKYKIKNPELLNHIEKFGIEIYSKSKMF